LSDLEPDLLDRVEVFRGDLRDSEAVRRGCRGCTHVFHLGALIGIPYSYDRPTEVVSSNVMGTLNVLLAAKDAHVERVVHVSSSEVYGTPESDPIREDDPFRAQSPYAASKIGADSLAYSFFRSYALPVVTVRPFNTYGPRQTARAVIPAIISQLLAAKAVRLGNLKAVRDFTYVHDTVGGLVSAAVALGCAGETIHLGTGKAISVGDLAVHIAGVLDRPLDLVGELQRMRPDSSEVEWLRADNAKARKLLQWRPSVSLEEGLQRTAEWIARNLDSYDPGQYAV
jgi:dTDP-glucose 4,6-dehydratase